ncbi:MAG: amino acid permease [Thermoanaerobaculales bacterium]|nr:amino acid permease [Thermoanaerobaculales bacterium]
MVFDTSAEVPVQKFGTFLGVFTPSILTILGLIMYLRFGWVVGNIGLGLTILLVLLASSITFITAFSASAVATNMRVGVGGEYFMISRSLGLELGGAIGIPLFLCRTLSITFYSFGLVESILAFWPATWGEMPAYTGQLGAAIIIIAITTVSGKSAALALKLQIPIMMAVGASLIALVIGAIIGGLQAPELSPTYRTAPQGFWYVFAVFFPAVTGFTAGIGMSGDLKDPRRSIPRGTLLAVITGTVIYLFIPIILSLTAKVTPEELAAPGIIWTKIAVLGGWLVFPGLWGAILSSAFGSMLGAPRVLQALADDGLAPGFLARLSPSGQPTIATWISGAIALGAVVLGGLNAVAQFVTILFLTLYVTVNISAAIEKLVGDPSYRPTINVPWYVSLLGSVGAVVMMFLINPYACMTAIFLEAALYLYLRRRALRQQWGDVWAGLWMAVARFALLNLRTQSRNPRNWRPHILLFAGDPVKRLNLVRLAAWFNQNRGVVTVCQLVVGDLKDKHHDAELRRQEMERDLEDAGLVAFADVDVVESFESGVINVTQANGIAGLRSNTVMFGWPRRLERLESQLKIMRGVSNAGKSTVIARVNWAHEPGREKRIDLWWGGRQHNGDLMLLFAYLLSLNPEWRDARIVIRAIARSEDERKEQEAGLKALLPEIRINAETQIIVKPPDQTLAEVIQHTSRGAAVVFFGLMEPEPGTEAEYARRLTALVEPLNTTIFVRNAGEFAGRLI